MSQIGKKVVHVTVPATSANLGSGFDALGLALNLYNEFSFAEMDGIHISSTDGIAIPTEESNLAYRSAKAVYDLCGKPFSGLWLEQTTRVPFSRGLGSSSTCIVGGIVGANALLGCPFSQEELLNLATKMEGHPDNVAPALLGGMVTSVLDSDHVYYIKKDLPDDLQFVVMIPDTELKTSVAREALPREVPHGDACYNLSRSALMALSLSEGRYENLRVAAQDKLHQPYRFPYIEKGQQVVDAAYNRGAYAAMISGAGSTLLTMVDAKADDFKDKMRNYLDEQGLTQWVVRSYKADNKGTTVVETKMG